MFKAMRGIMVPLLVCAASIAHAQDQTLGNAQVLATNGLFYGSGFSITSSGTVATTPAVGTFCFEDVNSNLYWLNGTALSSLAPNGSYTQVATLPTGSSCPVPANDGNYYGQSTGGGAYSNGTIYQMTPDGSVTTYYSFAGGPDGKGSSLPLLQGSNGEFYGANAAGDFFRYSSSSGFLSTTGTYIISPLYEGPDGSFFGVAYESGVYSDYKIVQINPSSVVSTQTFDGRVLGQFLNNPGAYFGGDGSVYFATLGPGTSPSDCGGGNTGSILMQDLYDPAATFQIGYLDLEGEVDDVEYTLAGNGTIFGLYAGEAYGNGPDDSCMTSPAQSTFYQTSSNDDFYANLTTNATHIAPGRSLTLNWKAGDVDLTNEQCFETGDFNAKLSAPTGSRILTLTVIGNHWQGFVCGGNKIATQLIDVSNTTLAIQTSNGATSFLPGATITLVSQAGPSGQPSPTGSVTFKSGSATIGSASLSATTYTATYSASTAGLFPGTYPVTAHYGGDTLYNAATSRTLSLTITKIPTTTVLGSPGLSYPSGNKITLIATITDQVAGHAPTGSITFYDGTLVLGSAKVVTSDGASTATLVAPSTGVAPGMYSVTAKYPGDTWNAPSTSGPLTITITPATTSVTLTASPNPVSHSASLTLSATVTGKSPTGTVFFYAGSTLLGSNTLDNGAASIVVPGNTLAVGSYQLTANYAGDGQNPAATSSPVTLTVQ